MANFNSTSLNELIRKIDIALQNKTALPRKEVETALLKIIQEPQSFFDLAKKSLNVWPTHGKSARNPDNFSYVNDPNTYYYLKYFIQQTGSTEAEILSDKKLFENRAIMRFLNLREPRTQRNVWETIARLKEPELNKFLVMHADHIEEDCPNSPGDLYSTAYHYQNYDLIDKLVAKKIIPKSSHAGKKHILTSAIKQNNAKIFAQIFDFILEEKKVFDSDIIMAHVFKKNAVDVFSYIHKNYPEILHTELEGNTNKIEAEDNLRVLLLARHKKAIIFSEIIKDASLVVNLGQNKSYFQSLLNCYFDYELTQFRKAEESQTQPIEFQTFFSRFDISNLVVRSALCDAIVTFTQYKAHNENKEFFKILFQDFITMLQSTEEASENQQVFQVGRTLQSFSQRILLYTDIAKIWPEFFENKNLQFFHNTEHYNTVLEAKNITEYQSNLNLAPRHIQDFLNKHGAYENENSTSRYHLPMPLKVSDKWLISTKEPIRIIKFLSYPEIIEHHGDTHAAKELTERYNTITARVERRQLDDMVGHQHHTQQISSKPKFKV